jgi:hypothetical protein
MKCAEVRIVTADVPRLTRPTTGPKPGMTRQACARLPVRPPNRTPNAKRNATARPAFSKTVRVDGPNKL